MDKNKSLKIANELMNDAFWLGYILKIKKRITDYSKKEILTYFLIFFSSIFAEEVVNAKVGGLSGKRKISLDDIKKLRMQNLKYCPSENSDTTIKTMKEMGIDFKNPIFDIVLLISDNNLVDINFRNWNLFKDDNFELIDGVVATPLRWIEILTPELFQFFDEAASELTEFYIKRINSKIIKRKTYSSSKLFKNTNITNNDKLYILQRYGLVKTMLFIDDILSERMSFDIGQFHFDSQDFIIKAKAIIIEMFWNDKKSNDSRILNQIINKNEKIIDKSFYSINRKSRNNLHYSDYHFLTKNEKEILLKNQNLYLDNLISIFDDNIIYDFGIGYKIHLYLAKMIFLLNKTK